MFGNGGEVIWVGHFSLSLRRNSLTFDLLVTFSLEGCIGLGVGGGRAGARRKNFAVCLIQKK